MIRFYFFSVNGTQIIREKSQQLSAANKLEEKDQEKYVKDFEEVKTFFAVGLEIAERCICL